MLHTAVPGCVGVICVREKAGGSQHWAPAFVRRPRTHTHRMGLADGRASFLFRPSNRPPILAGIEAIFGTICVLAPFGVSGERAQRSFVRPFRKDTPQARARHKPRRALRPTRRPV
jgi:hypothetical protein